MAQTIKKIQSNTQEHAFIYTLPKYTEDILASSGPILDGSLGLELNSKIWDISDEGNNYVTFTTQSATGLTISIKYTWVNINRLFIDVIATATTDTVADLNILLPVKKKNYIITDFSDQLSVNGLKARFELKDACSPSRITLYSDSDSSIQTQEDAIQLKCQKSYDLLKTGQSISIKLFLSEDYLFPRDEMETCINIDEHDTECIFTNIDQHDTECIFTNVDQHDTECIFTNVDQHNTECIFTNIDQHNTQII